MSSIPVYSLPNKGYNDYKEYSPPNKGYYWVKRVPISPDWEIARWNGESWASPAWTRAQPCVYLCQGPARPGEAHGGDAPSGVRIQVGTEAQHYQLKELIGIARAAAKNVEMSLSTEVRVAELRTSAGVLEQDGEADLARTLRDAADIIESEF